MKFILLLILIYAIASSSPVLFWILWGIFFLLACIVSFAKYTKKQELAKLPSPPQEYIDMIGDTRITLPSRRKDNG